MTLIGEFWQVLCLVLIFFLSLILFLFRSMEHEHEKDNLSAKLFCIRMFRKMKLEEFEDLISVVDYKICEFKMEKILLGIP